MWLGLLQVGGVVVRGALLLLLGLPVVADKYIFHVRQRTARDAQRGSVRSKDLRQSCASRRV
ncbi:hypothetical protein K457DRAFT_133905 [Linnemannia elongata AG-77]|uniref:Uncharacterized protein n=1 Tax=Linnemannia elongata AG-77 TaxID=1314771 RepID=A0A197KAV9_9FUNG|nr:hypothetical protein K457DRAFT_133905 [Linnemannia elongata AG-77]